MSGAPQPCPSCQPPRPPRTAKGKFINYVTNWGGSGVKASVTLRFMGERGSSVVNVFEIQMRDMALASCFLTLFSAQNVVFFVAIICFVAHAVKRGGGQCHPFLMGGGPNNALRYLWTTPKTETHYVHSQQAANFWRREEIRRSSEEGAEPTCRIVSADQTVARLHCSLKNVGRSRRPSVTPRPRVVCFFFKWWELNRGSCSKFQFLYPPTEPQSNSRTVERADWLSLASPRRNRKDGGGTHVQNDR